MWVFSRMVFLACLLSAQVQAQDPEPAENTKLTAHAIVSDASEKVMLVVEDAQGYVDEDPEQYYQAVHEILDPVIDYRGFARSVMGVYASKERYQSLDAAGRKELREQLERFIEVMRTGLIRTYGKGLLAFSGSRIAVSEPSADEAAESRVSVKQLIYSDETQPYVVMYQMGRGKTGEWKLRNVIIETVNLGEIYKNQFQAAARKHDGDLNVVIDEWSTLDVES
ncbi:MAG: ABC transporter substrate-binding protein [Halioglobus sp.]